MSQNTSNTTAKYVRPPLQNMQQGLRILETANTLLLHGPHARWDVSYHTKAYGMCLHFLRYVIRGGKKKKTGAKPFKVNPWLALHEHTSRDRRTT